MTLNISEIKNQKLKAIANNLDKDNNGKLNQEEFNLFKSVAINVTSAKAYNKACSLFKPEGAEAAKVETQNVDTVEVQENTQTTTQAKHGAVQREKNITNIQNTLIKCMNENKGLTLSQVMEELRENHIGRTCAQELDEIENIVNTIAAMGVNDKDGVESIKKNLRKTDGINTYAYRNIITLLEQVKENEVVQAEANVIKGIYDRVAKENPEITNIEERFELVERELEKENLKGTSYFSGKATKIAKDYAVKLAKEGIKIDNYEDREYLDADAKQKAAKDAAKGDKYTKKAVKESTTSYEVYANWNKYEQRGETIDKITEAELDGLSKGLREKLFDKFIPADAQEPYNFEEIYKIIGNRMGNDATVMHTDKNSREMDEYKNITDDLGALGKALSEKELKELIEFCGGTCAKKDRSIETASKEGLKNIGLGALVGLLNGIAVDLEQTMLINIDSSLANELIKDLEKGGHKVQTTAGKGEGKVGIILNQELLADTHAVTTIAGAIEGFAAGFLATVIFGKEQLEGDCVSLSDYTINDEKYTNYEQYKEYVTDKYPEMKANALLGIVENFRNEDGTIDRAGFNSYLNEIAGVGSKLNCIELLYPKRGQRTEETAPVELPDLDEDIVIDDEVVNSAEVYQEQKPELKLNYHVHKTQAKDTWEGIVKQYYPELVAKLGLWNKDGAIKQLQRAMSTKDGVFDADAFKTLIQQKDLKKELNIPTQITVNGVTYDITYGERVQGNFVTGGDGKANFGGYANVSFKFVNGDYVAICHQTDKTAKGKTKEEALANLQNATGLEYDLVEDYTK